MAKVYYFIGTVAKVGPLEFKRFGLRVSMEEDVARFAMIGGCQLAADETFKSFGFTDEDLKIWSDPFVDPFDVPAAAAQRSAKAEFLRKRDVAWAWFAEYRQTLVQERRDQENRQGVAEVGEMPLEIHGEVSINA